jgi:hypothetical protein
MFEVDPLMRISKKTNRINNMIRIKDLLYTPVVCETIGFLDTVPVIKFLVSLISQFTKSLEIAYEKNKYVFHRTFLIFNLIALFSSVSLFYVSCEVNTEISINGENPPTFAFSGSGYMTFFSLGEVASNEKPSNELWRVWPKSSIDKRMWNTPPIKYGQVPEFFFQTIPENGNPPKLVEGKIYEVIVQTSSAKHGRMRFIVRSDKTVQVPIPANE